MVTGNESAESDGYSKTKENILWEQKVKFKAKIFLIKKRYLNTLAKLNLAKIQLHKLLKQIF